VLPALQQSVNAAILQRLGAAFAKDRATMLRRVGLGPGSDLGAASGDSATNLTEPRNGLTSRPNKRK
jgi:hypothetical protein